MIIFSFLPPPHPPLPHILTLCQSKWCLNERLPMPIIKRSWKFTVRTFLLIWTKLRLSNKIWNLSEINFRQFVERLHLKEDSVLFSKLCGGVNLEHWTYRDSFTSSHFRIDQEQLVFMNTLNIASLLPSLITVSSLLILNVIHSLTHMLLHV